MNEIRYEGKMTDVAPAWCWETASNYALNPIDYTKISTYLKERHGKKRYKVIWSSIDELNNVPLVAKPQLIVINITNGKDSTDGKQYYARTNTFIEIDKTVYRIERELLMYVSSMLSQVLESTLRFYDNNKGLIMEIKE